MTTQKSMKYEAERDQEFAQWMTGVMGSERIRLCIQCGICSATCPVSHHMDYTPRRLINMAREGFKDEVLQSFTIWLCTSCYACTTECPKQIKVTDVMYALKRRAIQEEVYPKRFSIPVLAREFYKMVRAKGRISEGRLIFSLLMRTSPLKLLGMSSLGMGLLRTGRFSLRSESIDRREELIKLLDAEVISKEGAES